MELEKLNTKILNTSCPSCGKNYRIHAHEIHSHNPHFHCTGCESTFSFIYENETISQLKTLKVFAALETPPEMDQSHLKKCAKCGMNNPKLTQECSHCQVLLERIENLSLDKNLGALPSLMKEWQGVLGDYNNLQRHMSFVEKCTELKSLPFALSRYKILKEAQPQDMLTRNMFKKIMMIQVQNQSAQRNSLLDHPYWEKSKKLAPLMISLSCIIIGMSKHSIRNLVGLGVVILFVYIGLLFLIKGKVKISDFW